MPSDIVRPGFPLSALFVPATTADMRYKSLRRPWKFPRVRFSLKTGKALRLLSQNTEKPSKQI
jgi:hypothetical protein